jgi:multiple sugar transport system permease protein
MILIATLLRVIWLSQSVDLIYVINYGGPALASTTVAVYAYVVSTVQFDFGYGAAIALSLAFVMLLVATAYVRLASRLEVDLR